ncbi:hypothetical protein J7F03_27770 [Streptomyces sp. ISL-43]|uniref:hypothetical protein n=1 Tax=Streptomyces sp. ISL-43 TaxID=2819183 RepID=UPI001BE645A3|nr:hypothetical protein [Streptomyces sp. ISL-43]MBT2450804.1 hypothetical protein [Streptomyces sp. ISL-43]
MVTATGYAYPWDFVDDPAAADRAREAGVTTVAVAANYHRTRAATPLHPRHRLVDAEHAACYLPIRPAAWQGMRLVPRVPGWTVPDSFAVARKAIVAAGLRVAAWTVLTHNSVLGHDHPDLVRRNAFDEPYKYALCPQAPQVADYCATLVHEVALLGEADGLILEAAGPLGVDHGGHHDKTEFAQWTPVQRELLSLCFCASCRRVQRAGGLDPERVAAQVRAALGPAQPPKSPDDALGAQTASVLRGCADANASALHTLLVAAARTAAPGIRITVHGSASAWATGAFAPLGPTVTEGVDAVVANCWAAEPGPPAGGPVAALRHLAPPATTVGGYFRPETLPATEEGLGALAARYVAAGLGEAHLYHLGLVPRAGLDRLRDFVTALRSA